jgi:hypothetical protein
MKKLLIILLCSTFAIQAEAQLISFMKTYGNGGYDFGRDIKQDTDSGYVVTGSSSSFVSAQSDVYLLKVDSVGNFKWSVNYGGQGSDWGQSLVVTNDSSYAIGGFTNSVGFGGFDFYLLRINENGDLLWENTYGGADWDKAYGLVETADSGFVLAGESYSFNSGVLSAYAIRVDKLGDVVWSYVENHTGESYFTDIAIEGDSLIFCGGKENTLNNSMDGFIKTMHIDGTSGSERLVGENFDDYFTSVYVEGGFYNFGGARANNFDTEKTNMWNYRIQSDWTLVYDQVYVNSSPEYDQINDIVTRWYNQDTYFIGETKSYGYQLDGENDVFLGKCSSGGIYFQANNFGEVGADIGQAVDNCIDDGAVFLFDSEFFSTGGNNIVIMKLNYTWTFPDQFADISYDDITTSIFAEAEELNIYPNPVTDAIYFGKEINGTIQIHDLSGKLILSENLAADYLNLESLDQGMFILTLIESKSNTVYRAQILKN